MANKAQIMDYISEKFKEPDGLPVSLAKLDKYKKAELEEFIKERGEEDNLEKWIENR